jgi:hypothetical protein
MVETTFSIVKQAMNAKTERRRALTKQPGVRVVPANDDMRRLLRHPKAGRFRSEGGLEWPNDTFTKKRLRDGDVKLESEAKAESAKAESAAKAESEAASKKPHAPSHSSHAAPHSSQAAHPQHAPQQHAPQPRHNAED